MLVYLEDGTDAGASEFDSNVAVDSIRPIFSLFQGRLGEILRHEIEFTWAFNGSANKIKLKRM